MATLERPMLSGGAKPATAMDEAAVSDEIRKAQNAYLLLQLLDVDGATLIKGEANHLIPGKLQTSLSLKPATANLRRAKLAERGYLRITKSGRSEMYSSREAMHKGMASVKKNAGAAETVDLSTHVSA